MDKGFIAREPLLTESLQRSHMNGFPIKNRVSVTPKNS